MDEPAKVLVHESAFPGAVSRGLREGLAARHLDQKFLYVGWKQTRNWLALHEGHSPARRDEGTAGIYEQAFARAAELAGGSILHVLALAPGGGQKETRALEVLRERGKTVFFTPVDFSLEVVLSAHEAATSRLRGLQSTPILCDLPRCSTLPGLLKDVDPGGTQRLVTFFGTLHNFEPGEILPRIVNAIRAQDAFLLSANLAPEDSYEGALGRILPQYRNELAAEWMLGLLEDLGIGREDGELEIGIETGQEGLKRIEAGFVFRGKVAVRVGDERVEFNAGERLGLFFSYRFTCRAVREQLEKHGLAVAGEWVSPTGEEGVFLCKRGERGGFTR